MLFLVIGQWDVYDKPVGEKRVRSRNMRRSNHNNNNGNNGSDPHNHFGQISSQQLTGLPLRFKQLLLSPALAESANGNAGAARVRVDFDEIARVTTGAVESLSSMNGNSFSLSDFFHFFFYVILLLYYFSLKKTRFWDTSPDWSNRKRLTIFS